MKRVLLYVCVLGLFAIGCSDHLVEPSEDAEPTTSTEAAVPTGQQVTGIPCEEGELSSGALFEICEPQPMQPGAQPDVLVIYAGGFTFPHLPLEIPVDEVDGGIAVRDFVTGLPPLGLGFSYATTSFYTTGLLDPNKAVKDLRELIARFTQLHGRPEQVLLAGVSNGAFQSLLTAERHSGLFDSAIASCGPVGGIGEQIQYWGDIFVLFNHFFPGVIPGGPDGIDAAWLANITGSPNPSQIVGGLVSGALTAGSTSDPTNPGQTERFLSVLAGTEDLGLGDFSAEELLETVVGVMLYAVFSTNDAIAKLRGNVYDNTDRMYSGLLVDDNELNEDIARFQADRNAVAQLRARYRPSGQLRIPVASLHNERDPIVPSWHQDFYEDELLRTRSELYVAIDVEKEFGHCDFTLDDWGNALASLPQPPLSIAAGQGR